MTEDELPPEGWYDDPERPGTYRWWNGQQWTEHRREPDAPSGQASSDDGGASGLTDKLKSAASTTRDAASNAKQAYDDRQQAKAREQTRTTPDDEGQEPLMTVTSHDPGKNALVSLFPDRIERVKERSMLSLSSANQDAEVIPISRVGHVRANKDGWRTNVHVSVSGEDIVFRVSHDEAEQFKDAIMAQILARDEQQQQAARPQQQPHEQPPDDADQIRKLAELRDEGILTDEEFQAKKREILGI